MIAMSVQCAKRSNTFMLAEKEGVCCSDDGKLDTRPPMLVTASVDAIQLRKRLAIETDMTVHGQVVWTGSSSMDIRMELLQVCSSSIRACAVRVNSSKSCMHVSEGRDRRIVCQHVS